MGRKTSAIDITKTDETINALLQAAPDQTPSPESPPKKTVSFNFNQNEDLFITLDSEITIPSLPVHHSMDNYTPPPGYVEAIASICAHILSSRPELIRDTTWCFDPISIHNPSFYRIDECEGLEYLYFFRLDLTCRPLESRIIADGTNATTKSFATKRLYIEADYYPLPENFRITEGDRTYIRIDQTIPATWKGEAGEGYMIHGIWMDADINKFFSKLALPVGKRNHPFYPLTCKQYSVSMNALGLDGPCVLHRVRRYIERDLDRILDDLQNTAFSEQMPLFMELKEKFPPEPGLVWQNLNVKAYLNEREQKEYSIEF